MKALKAIRDKGFSVTLAGDGFEIVPASALALTPNQREFLKLYRAEIIEELQAETRGISASDRQTLLDYLAAIGETDPAMIDEYLTAFERDPAILAGQLQHARRVIKSKSDDY